MSPHSFPDAWQLVCFIFNSFHGIWLCCMWSLCALRLVAWDTGSGRERNILWVWCANTHGHIHACWVRRVNYWCWTQIKGFYFCYIYSSLCKASAFHESFSSSIAAVVFTTTRLTWSHSLSPLRLYMVTIVILPPSAQQSTATLRQLDMVAITAAAVLPLANHKNFYWILKWELATMMRTISNELIRCCVFLALSITGMLLLFIIHPNWN